MVAVPIHRLGRVCDRDLVVRRPDVAARERLEEQHEYEGDERHRRPPALAPQQEHEQHRHDRPRTMGGKPTSESTVKATMPARLPRTSYR